MTDYSLIAQQANGAQSTDEEEHSLNSSGDAWVITMKMPMQEITRNMEVILLTDIFTVNMDILTVR